jgi:hypothetical protein
MVLHKSIVRNQDARCISKIYQEFYEGIIYMANEGRHIRVDEYLIAA